MKLDKFKEEYMDKLLGSDKDVYFAPSYAQAQVYYFNVDIKFILKARLYQLARDHEESIQ